MQSIIQSNSEPVTPTHCSSTPSTISPLNNELLSVIQDEFIKNNTGRESQLREVLDKGPIEVSKAKDKGGHHVFTHLIQPQVNAVNQEDAALCWVYANLSLLSIGFIRDNNLPLSFQFSAAHFVFYDKLEKANLFLHKIMQLKESPFEEMAGLLNTPTEEGGEPCGFANIVNKYGLVPHDAMVHPFCMQTTKYLNRALHKYLRHCAQDLREEKGDINQMIAHVYKILAVNLGVPPREFDWPSRGESDGQISKKLTPLQFSREYVKYNSDDYIDLGSNSLEEDGTLFESDRWRNMIEGKAHRYINVKMDDILGLIDQSLDNGIPVMFASDVRNGKSDKDGIFDVEYAHKEPLYDENRAISREDALRYRHIENYHMMVITGYTPQKHYQVLNSWSRDFGMQGYYSMSVDYARDNLFRIIIRTEFASEQIKEIWKTAKPRQLGPHDLVL